MSATETSSGSTATAEPIRLAVIVASNRPNRFGPTVANWFVGRATEHGDFAVDLVDLADFDLPPMLSGGPDPELDRFVARLADADAFVIVTPEYNHSFPGNLKHAIDLAGRAFMRKVVAFVSYGGMSGGLRAVEALRPVMSEVHAATTREVVSFHGAWDRFDDDGVPHDAMADKAAAVLLDDLAWWAAALRSAR